MAEEQVAKVEEMYPDPIFKEMLDAGVFYGRKKSRTNPRMKQFILANRNGIEIINLGKTVEGLEAANKFLKEKVRNGGLILFVATQPPAADTVNLATEYGYPVVSRRWLGGTLTNFKIISKRIEYFKKLKEDWKNNAFEKYTKKERLMIEKELGHMSELMTGLEPLVQHPVALIVVDPNLHATAVREARILNIPVIAFMNTDCDPDSVAYPVVGNNKSRISINWFLTSLRAAIAEGKAMGPEKAAVPEVKAPAHK